MYLINGLKNLWYRLIGFTLSIAMKKTMLKCTIFRVFEKICYIYKRTQRNKNKNERVIASLPNCQLLEAQKKLSLAKEMILPLFLWHFRHAWRGTEFTLRFQKNTTFLLSKKVSLLGRKLALKQKMCHMCCSSRHQPKIANNHKISSSLMYMYNCWPLVTELFWAVTFIVFKVITANGFCIQI